MKKCTVLFVVILMALPIGAQQIIVPNDQFSVQVAIDTATIGDTILVEEGTYFENIDFKGKAITVASRFILDGDTSHISKTILDGSQSTKQDTGSVVMMWSGEDSTSVLSGFTITGGTGSLFLSDFDFGPLWEFGGGGIAIVNGGGKITDNIIEHNHLGMPPDPGLETSSGAGIYANARNYKSCVIRNNHIRNNSIKGKWPIGAAIGLISGRHIVEGNVISHNLAEGSDNIWAGIFRWANHWTESTIHEVVIRNNVITHNRGICPRIDVSGSLSLFHSFWDAFVQVSNNIIAFNQMDGLGGGILIRQGAAELCHNTIWNNEASQGGHSMVLDWPDRNVLYNNIIWSEAEGSNIEFPQAAYGRIVAFNNIMNEPFITHKDISSANNMYTQPFFLEGGFALDSSGPGIGRGIDSLLAFKEVFVPPRTDMAGNQRPAAADERIDVGALESPYEAFVYVPDTLFLKELIAQGVDRSGDGKISFEEAEDIGTLRVPDIGINDLTGIETFTALDTLDCSNNNLEYLSVSTQNYLRELNCSENSLSHIDTRKNGFLGTFWADYNTIQEIDLSGNLDLEHVGLSHNELSDIDVHENIQIENLQLGHNQLRMIALNQLTELSSLDVSNNLMSQLYVGKNTRLVSLSCNNNKIKRLDLTNNPELALLGCGGNLLQTLDLSQNVKLGTDPLIPPEASHVYLDSMESLCGVCVWTLPFPNESTEVDITGSPNVFFVADCDSVDLPVIVAPDKVSRGDSIEASINMSGVIYLVPINTDPDIDKIKELVIEMSDVEPNVKCKIPSDQLEDQEYMLFAAGPTGKLSSPHIINMVVGWDYQDASGIKVFPIPASRMLTIETGQMQAYHLELVSISGRSIASQHFNGSSCQLDVSEIRSGIYILKIESDDLQRIIKVMIQ